MVVHAFQRLAFVRFSVTTCSTQNYGDQILTAIPVSACWFDARCFQVFFTACQAMKDDQLTRHTAQMGSENNFLNKPQEYIKTVDLFQGAY